MNELKAKTMEMKNWAVIGATTDKDRFGYKIVKTLKDNNYNVYPVTPKYEKVAGLKAYNRVSDIDDEIDVVDFVVNPQIGIKLIEDVEEKNINYIWLQPGSRSEELKQKAENNGIEVVEDCIYASLT